MDHPQTKCCSYPHHVGERDLSVDMFGKNRSAKDGLQARCRECCKAYSKTDKRKATRRAYEQTVAHKAARSAYQKTDKYKAALKVYQKTEKFKAWSNAWQRNRKKTLGRDHKEHIGNRLRSRLSSALLWRCKSGSAVLDLGCCIDDFKFNLRHDLERGGWTWEDHGTKFHLDHIIPFASFNLSIRGELVRAIHYTNLQAISIADNLSKSDADVLALWDAMDQEMSYYRYLRSAEMGVAA